MTGPKSDALFQYIGVKKYFSYCTLTSKMNCVLATYGGIELLVLYFKLKLKKKNSPSVLCESSTNGFKIVPYLLSSYCLVKLTTTRENLHNKL
ncbi:ATP synthase membrane subunit K, mitochondrial-like [Erinaceus europaeus]|uniref:ATP synthase membrane subunit K, mitochondrial-like n=1 Tax=Erinaceus europaeus TaxID=9365 RepID=A0ABM3X6Z9_ERIEU|nr:ATP synthase membrane subunit K, mitochondrial-like [Erinaceus europaeus]